MTRERRRESIAVRVRTGRPGRTLAASLLLLFSCAPSIAAQAGAIAPSTMREIAEIHARSMVSSGQTPGIGVAIIDGDAPPAFFTYGFGATGSRLQPPKPFSPDMLFEIGSNTKLFTTNLLGQRVYDGTLNLERPLSSYAAQLGTLRPLTRRATLGQLGAFVGGIADSAPPCRVASIPGCLPSGRPTIDEYTAADFAAYFRFLEPRDYGVDPPRRVLSLPAPYNYSNFGVGMLGLLLAAAPDEPLGNDSLQRWHALVRSDILEPLGMQDTWLDVPPELARRKAIGYDQATARAEVADGAVTGIAIGNPGAFYAQPPTVRVVGGGGSGAAAVATLDRGRVHAVDVTQGGRGYIAPARVAFNDGGSTALALADAIVVGSRVVGVAVRSGGANYRRVPRVTISGGRMANGRDATATAHLVNGRVGYVTVDDPGEGYVAPLAVVVSPGGTVQNAIPIWAAAGALTSTLRDMAKFAQAALGQADDAASLRVAQGFEVARRPYACQGSDDPDLAACPDGAVRSALGWLVRPADAANGVPSVVAKGGALPGKWSYIALMPERELGVVVFMNTRPNDITSVPEDISRVAENILYALMESKAAR